MKTAQEIITEVKDILATKWKTRDGLKVPEPEDIKLGNDAVMLAGTVLYADMADSTALVNNFKDWFAAEVYKSYLVAACHLIRNNSGSVTAFDGDRVMAVYIGDSKNSDAARTALQLNWLMDKINQELKRAYPNSAFQLRHSAGIDTSNLFVAKTGVRLSNDLVWVGRAANYAAKLSSISELGYSSFITEDVYEKLNDKSKNGGNPKRSMWDKTLWQERNITIYKSNWTWEV
ncbi:MAG TPA: adenylate/guanylate cyclase domain-containing protein [Candidatus Acidoferrum sp.]|jgi:class 3 adenylate cyclase|nr:adenylate/guanylate cyclase domain-containing protein [Candidatus Acidoferrum sp.]